VLRRAGLTPSDVLFVSDAGDWREFGGIEGDRAAARAGVQIVARQLGVSAELLTHRVLERVVDRVAQEMLEKLVSDQTGHSLFPAPQGWAFLLDRMLGHGNADAMACHADVGQPIVAVGAPVAAFMPRVADKLHTQCIIPPHAEVGNAVGTVVASVTHTVEILVQPRVMGTGTLTFLVHNPHGRESFNHFPEAADRAEEVAVQLAQETVTKAGGEVSSVKVDRHEVVLGKLSEMTVRACAIGRPRLGASDVE
jgi:N-methylhydantoinase A/oxoprolinase/acetone carboxylase beta subunit